MLWCRSVSYTHLLSYYDTTEWDKHYKETIKDIEGKYPSNEKEAAKRLGCSVRNVTKHRLKALDKLRGLL